MRTLCLVLRNDEKYDGARRNIWEIKKLSIFSRGKIRKEKKK